MAFDMTTFNVTRVAGVDLSSAQYHCVKQNTSGAAVLCNTAGESVFGILLNDPLNNQSAAIAVTGVAKVVAGGAIAIGNLLSVNAQGRLIVATAGKKIIGEAMSSATDDGQMLSVLLRNGAASA
ncbi:DUF2190 family protein [Rhodoferax sp. 4810]|uniref:DUF2190 family protein n=2 Tax=Thiospirillum jenense TaxID=1653858 RepID=A0A839H913_9GAMM|nr:DUF2190 family protein [Rhodoferax jenense]MBB1125561.1 DUF2190 family protein [Thiospirillum jenense]